MIAERAAQETSSAGGSDDPEGNQQRTEANTPLS